jgi:hypothetical protein
VAGKCHPSRLLQLSRPAIPEPVPFGHRAGMPLSTLLDDRSIPDFRDHYLRLMKAASQVFVAASRIRLGGLQVEVEDLLAPRRIQVLVMEMSGITLAMEAERLAEQPRARDRLETLVRLLDETRLSIRSCPLGGWSPDFSVFESATDGLGADRYTLLVGPHWMDRPYPHRGPALTSVHSGESVVRVRERFGQLWDEAHDVGGAVRGTLAMALARCGPVPADRDGRG